MYKLEDRILFDGAAVADIADAQQEAEAQQEAAEAAEAEEAAQQEAAENADGSEGGESDSSTGGESDDSSSLESVLAEIEAGNLGADGQRVDVLLVSDSLENADDIANATSSNTIVVRYDARTTSAADLLQQITDALDGNLADSIGFVTESGENAAIQLFADTDTSLDTVNNSVHQDFFNALDNMMDEGAQVNLFASNLASTAEGTALVDAIGDSLDHDVAASTDETGAESAGGDWDLEYSTNDNEVDVAETYFDENLIENFDALLEDDVRHEVAFINSSVMNVDEILEQLDPDIEIVMLEAGGDGLEQITEYLNEHSNVKYDAVHIITHGNEGYFNLSNSHVDSDYVQANSAELVQWRNALSDDADIMIYGCNLAGSTEGRDLISQIASATGADIAASTDMVRNNDWSLEYNIGNINYGSLDVLNYNHNLVDYLVTTIKDVDFSSKLTLREAIDLINNEGSGGGGTISFAAVDKLGGTVVRLGADAGYRDLSVTGNVTINGQISLGNNAYTYVKITRAAVSADTGQLEADRTVLETYTDSLDDDIAAIQAAIDAVADPANPTYAEIAAMRTAVNNTMGKTGPNVYTGSAYNTFLYAGLVDTDGDTIVTTAEADAAAITDPAQRALAEADAEDARDAQDLIDDPTTGFDTLIASNWASAKAASTTFSTVAEAQAFVNWFTAMSTNSTNMYSPTAADPTDTIIDEATNVAVRSDTNPADHYRLMTVSQGGNLTLINADLYGGYSDAAVSGGIAAGRGGAIYIAEGSSATLTNVDITSDSRADSSLFTANQASHEGGAIYNAGSLTINTDSSKYAGPAVWYGISENKAGTSGGGIYSTGDISIKGPSITATFGIDSNTATAGSGGGLYSEGTISLMENVYFNSNTASLHGGGAYVTSINDALEFKTVDFDDNSATNGSGGALAYVDSPGALTISQSDFYGNEADVNGGAIYMENTGDFTFLGTQYISDQYQFCYENSWIAFNEATDGNGGAFYLNRVGNVLLNSIDFEYNRLGDTTSASGTTGGAVKMTNSGNLTIIDSNFKNNYIYSPTGTDTAMGGAIFYDGGTDGDKTLSINTSYLGNNWTYYNSMSNGNGGAIYQTAGTLTITNVTFDDNTAYGNGGAIYIDSSVVLSLNFCTLVNNSATNSGSSIFVNTGAAVTGSINLTNTIIHNTSTPSAQIVLPTDFTIKSSSYNIFSHYSGYGASAQRLADGTVTSATNYLDAAQNYVGTASGGSTYILNNIYISTTAVYTANYKTYTLGLTNENSIAYRSGTNNGVTYDQRGNTRTVDPYGASINASRGAFEPIFNMVVNSTEDTSNLLRSDPAGYYANLAWADGITLREAVYWIDSGDGTPNPTRGVISFNGAPGTTAKSGHNFYADGADNKITLNGYQINIGQYRRSYSSDKTIIINGVAASQDASNRVIVDANNASRAFCLVEGTTTINHLTIENGNAPKGSSITSASGLYGGSTDGGAIYNYSGSTLTLNNVLVRNSTANAGDYKDTGYGGGIYNGGTLTLNDTTVTGNNAIAVADSNHVRTDGGHGGGIYNTGTLRLYRSTIDNNTTTGNTYVTESAKGGGIYNRNGYLYIENSTIAYNHNLTSASIETGGEGSAIYFDASGSTLQLKNSTIAHNHTTSGNEGADWTLKSGVYVNAISTLTIENTILADNYVDIKVSDAMVGHWNDFYTVVNPTTASTTYNVIGFFNYDVYDFRDYTANHVGAYLTDVGNPERGRVQDLYLNETLDYRGGRTKVLSLLEGSLLLDLATNPGKDVTLASITDYMTGATVIANPDQRGNTRVSGSYSIGSYQPLFAVTVDVTTDATGTNHGWDWGGYTTENPPANAPGWTSNNSFRDALYWIDPTGTISMGAAVTGETITLNKDLGQLSIDKSMTIVGAGITLQAATSAGTAAYRVMSLTNPAHLNSTIAVKLQNMTIQNGVGSYGGGIYNTSNLTLEGVSVQNNKSSVGHGGGIYSLGGSLTIGTYSGATTVYSNITGNTAKSRGGGIYYEGQSTLTITQTDVLNNTATDGSGGGIYVTGANFTLTQSTIGNNTAKVNGGGINSMSTDITMVNSTIANNTTGELGGGLAYFISGTLDMNFVTIANNISGTNTKVTSLFGGGIYMSAGTFNMTNSVIAQNYRTSISDSNRDDFYVGATISTGTVSYNVFGKTENFTIPGSSNIELGVTNPWTDLALDTELTDNGGPTMTLYVFNTDSVLQNGATPGSGATITVDQRGTARPATGQPTIGAYQKSITSWVYVGSATATATELANVANWRDATTGAVVTGDIIAPDRTLYFDPTRAGGIGTDNVTITETWDVNYKTSVVLDGTAHVTVAVASTSDKIVLTAGLSVMGGSAFTLGNNAEFIAATNTRVVISEANSIINANNTFTGTVDVSTGTLKLNSTDAKLSNLTLGSLNATSTVEYAYDENQTVRTGTYGNLTISGSGTKTSNDSITVTDTVTVNNSTFKLGGDLSTTDIALSNGIISGSSHAITSTGDTTAAGTSSITGGIITLNTMSAYSGNISGSTVTIGGAASITGDITASGTLTANGALTLDNANLTGGTSVVLTNTVTTTAGTALVSKANTIKASAITMDFAGSSAITVNDYSTLTFNTNSANITINTDAGNTANTFRANDMTVSSNGSLEFLTTGNITLYNVTGTAADGIAGSFILRGRDITLNGASFNNATLTLGNTNNLNIGSLGFTSVNSVIFDGVVNITGTGATISSTSGNLTFNKNVIGGGYDFNITANNGSVSVSSVTNAGDLVVTAGTTATIGNIAGSSLTVNSTNGIALNGTVNMTGAVTLNDAVSVASGQTASITGNTLTIGGAITGAGNLSLGATAASPSSSTLTNGVNLTGNLSLTDGIFTTNAAVNSADLNIASQAELQMGANTLTTSGNLTNAGTLSSTTGAVNVGDNLTNSNSLSVNSAVVTGNITNSGSTFTVPTLTASGNITNTGTMTVATALNIAGTGTSTLSLGGSLNTASLTVANNKNVNLANGNITVTTFTFTGATTTSKFALASGTTVDATTINDSVAANYYDGAYFNTSAGGKLVRTMTGSAVEYRLGNATSATVVTLNTTAGEKIAVHVLDSVRYNGGIVTGIEDTAGFTTVINRNWGGTSGTADIDVTENWSTALEGSGFDPAISTNLFVLNGSWTNEEGITVTFNPVSGGRRSASYTLPHNGTYAYANIDADMTIPITDLNGNVALWEMASPKPLSMSEDLDVDDVTNFPIGTYPYFTVREYKTAPSVGEEIYKQMQYRLVSEPITNLLGGQVPPIGSVVGQAITEGASLTLTTDAPVYLEVNGEYSIGENWLPLGTPASAGNIENFQAPITQGQLDEFYLEFGGQKGALDTPESFKSDLDEMLDDLLAG